MICVLISLAYVAGVIIAGSSKGGELLTETSVVSVCLICSLVGGMAGTFREME